MSRICRLTALAVLVSSPVAAAPLNFQDILQQCKRRSDPTFLLNR